MSKPLPPVDPNHEAKRAVLSKLGMGLLAAGIPCCLFGIYLFISQMFTHEISASRSIVGLLLFGGGGFCAMIGVQILFMGNAGKLLRYQAGEALPVAQDVVRHTMPLYKDIATELVHGARKGWTDGEETLVETKIPHHCGTWNELNDKFCKGCGAPLDRRECQSCHTQNELDAQFCNHCGAAMTA